MQTGQEIFQARGRPTRSTNATLLLYLAVHLDGRALGVLLGLLRCSLQKHLWGLEVLCCKTCSLAPPRPLPPGQQDCAQRRSPTPRSLWPLDHFAEGRDPFVAFGLVCRRSRRRRTNRGRESKSLLLDVLRVGTSPQKRTAEEKGGDCARGKAPSPTVCSWHCPTRGTFRSPENSERNKKTNKSTCRHFLGRPHFSGRLALQFQVRALPALSTAQSRALRARSQHPQGCHRSSRR